MSSNTRWKRREREVAKMLDTKRIPHMDGIAHCDVATPHHDLQVKSRASVPKWLTDAYDQAVSDCSEGKTPAVVLVAEQGQGRKARRFIILALEDWVKEQSDAPQ